MKTRRTRNDSHDSESDNKRPKLAKIIREAKKLEPEEMTGQEALKIFKELVESSEWSRNGEKIRTDEAKFILYNAALEARRGCIYYSPHILLEGEAGTGKTLLCQLLYPSKIAGLIPNDSEGVGQMRLDQKQKILKVDDATDAFWGSSRLLGAIYTMYHNEWAVKITGKKEVQDAAIAIITSNGMGNLSRFGRIADGDGAKRRFVVGRFEKRFFRNSFIRVTQNTCDELFEILTTTLQVGESQDTQVKELMERFKELQESIEAEEEREGDGAT